MSLSSYLPAVDILACPLFPAGRMHALTDAHNACNMPRTKKRKLDTDVDDPTEYIRVYCDRRGLPKEYGNSTLEKECQALAQQAREDYKNRRDGKAQRDVLDRKGLSPAEKYTIRLQNNRKSADASKVYNEVLKREQAHRLATLTDARNIMSDVKPIMYQSQQRTINALQKEIDQLKRDNSRLSGMLRYERTRGDKLHKQVQHLQQTQFQAHVRTQPMPIHPPVQQSQSQSQPTEGPESVPESAPQSLHQRLVTSRTLLQPWNLSPAADGEAKEFHTGLTCSQSQPEEADDKGLVRSMPLSAGLPLNLLGSQPSQEIPAFKSTIGSDELPIPPESEFFLGSQGTTKGRGG